MVLTGEVDDDFFRTRHAELQVFHQIQLRLRTAPVRKL